MNKQAGAEARLRAAFSFTLRDACAWPGYLAIKLFYSASEGNAHQRSAWIRGWDETEPFPQDDEPEDL
jgi:hypothetical protein